MIKGATQLLAGIPGRYLDPFHLAQSQPGGFSGYIVISYRTEHRVWDTLILCGREIAECSRIGEEHRRPVEAKEVEDRFRALGESSRIFLFESTPLLLDPFRRTLRAVPALKVQVDPLSREQLIKLIRNVPETPLVAERSLVGHDLPLYEFLEIKSPQQHIEFQMRFRKGLLLLYRLEGSGEDGPQLQLRLEESGGGGEVSCERAATPALSEFLRKFRAEASLVVKKKELIPLAAGEGLFEGIPLVLKAARPIRRVRLRRAVCRMLGELYSDGYEELKQAGLLENVEKCYRQLKG